MTSIENGLTILIKTQLKIRHYVLFNFIMYSKIYLHLLPCKYNPNGKI